jgi:hypothetical protein
VKEHKLPISKLPQEITNLPDRFTEELEATIVTRSGKKVMAILPYRTYWALLETIDYLKETLKVIHDPELTAAIRQSAEDIKNGNGTPLEDCLKEVG